MYMVQPWESDDDKTRASGRTCVEADPHLELLVGPVPDTEGGDGRHEVEGHGGALPRMQLPVPRRQAAHDHVGVTYRLHLWDTSPL